MAFFRRRCDRKDQRASCFLFVAVGVAILGCGDAKQSPNGAGNQPTSHQPDDNLKTVSNRVGLPPPVLISQKENTTVPPARFRFVDVTEQSRVVHLYENGESGQSLMVEATGGGVAWLDYDADGELDLLLNQGGNPVSESDGKRPPDQLFRGLGYGTFDSVGHSARIDDGEYSQGITVGDFDNDGFGDVYFTSIRHNVLFRNQGDGTFLNVTETAGVDDPRWSSSAAWGDLDHDGDLDLYVCNYANYDADHPKICRRLKSGLPAMCHPRDVEPVPDECFENLGNGTFRRVAKEWGLEGPGNRALGVAIADFDNNGSLDVYVANDTTANFLFLKQQEQRFEESAMLLGCALSAQGAGQASMGVTVGDYDNNGFLDVFLTHFAGEYNTLYRNLGPEGFQDRTAVVGLVEPSMPKLGFGTVMLDFDQDGAGELFVVNGHIDRGADGEEYEMQPQLFSKRGNRFLECSQQAGDYFQKKFVGRGVASGDFDRDGDWDLAVIHQHAPAVILRNDSQRGHWLKIRGIGRQSTRTPIGLRVTLHRGDQTLMQELAGGTSYCSSHEPVLIFGVGDSSEPCNLDVRWPSGMVQRIENVALDQTLTLLEPLE